jgi:hypothetical protein
MKWRVHLPSRIPPISPVILPPKNLAVADPAGGRSGDVGSLLRLASGRTGACVPDWLAEQTEVSGNASRSWSSTRPHRGRPGYCRPAERVDGGSQVAPGGAGQPDGHRGLATGHSGSVGPVLHCHRPRQLSAAQSPSVLLHA